MKYEYWLATLYRLGNEKRRHVCEMTGSAKEFYHLSDRQLKSLHLFSEEERTCIIYSKETFDIEGEWNRFIKRGIQFVPWKCECCQKREVLY